MPVGTSGRGPKRGSSRVVPSGRASMSAPIIGRNARPVWIGE